MASWRSTFPMRRVIALPSRKYSSRPSYSSEEIASLLRNPVWSVRSLLPDESAISQSPSITPEKLHHLLRLSALPQPVDKVEEEAMLKTLESQIHFVKEIQNVDTTNFEPLRSIRDESKEAVKESSIGVDDLKEALAKEQVTGRSNRIHRMQNEKTTNSEGSEWDGNALGSASKSMGKYFVVQTGK